MRWTAMMTVMAVLSAGAVARGQKLPGPPTPPVLTNSPGQEDTAAAMLERGRKLLEKAKASKDGSASEILNQYDGFYTMMVARTRSGQVEVHTSYDDFFFVLEGELTEVVGGTMVGGEPSRTGETRGRKLEGGTPNTLRRDDIIHIAANTPHLTTVPEGKTVIYYVIKVGVRK